MPRYLIERHFDDGFDVPATSDGASICFGFVQRNADHGVTWLHSYVSDDKRRTYDVCDGPNAEAIRAAAARNGLPIVRITKVTVLDPYFHH